MSLLLFSDPENRRRLREQKVPNELIVIPNEIHDFLVHRSWLTYFHAQSDFLDGYLLR